MAKRRLQHIYDMARTKSACEGGDTMDKNFDPLTGDTEDMMKHTVRCATFCKARSCISEYCP